MDSWLWLMMVLPLALVVGFGVNLTWRRPRGSLTILEERYARGEIEREEFIVRSQDLES